MVDLVNNVVALRINSRDRIDINDSTTDFTVMLKKSLRNIAALNVAGVVIPRTDTLISSSNDVLSGSILVDDNISLFNVSIPRRNYTIAELATQLQTQLNASIAFLSFAMSVVISYSAITNRMAIDVTYPTGASRTWAIQITYTNLKDVIGIGKAGTTGQTFSATAGATVLSITCERAPNLTRALSYNITSSYLTNSMNTSYITSLGKLFNVNDNNNLLSFNSKIVTNAHTTFIDPPQDSGDNYIYGGSSIGLTRLGDTMIVGSGRGVFIYTRSSVTNPWVSVSDTPLRDSSYLYRKQGIYAAISGDGSTIAYGAISRVYVYIKSGNQWALQTIISPLVKREISAVSLNINGLTLAVVEHVASVYTLRIYIRTSGVWSEQFNTVITYDENYVNGNGVALSNTGDNLVCVKTLLNTTSADVFRRTGNNWLYDSNLLPNDSIGGPINGVAISGDGNYIAMSSAYDNSQAGATWIYMYDGAQWVSQQKILVSSMSVAINDVGNTVVIGGPAADLGTGRINVWTRTGTEWTVQLSDYTLPGYNIVGYTVAMTSDGNNIIWSANEGNVGTVWASHRVDSTWAIVTGSRTSGGGGNVIQSFGDIIALSEDGKTMAAGFPNHNSNEGVVYVYVSNGLTWDIQASISVQPLASPSLFGSSVSLSADGNTLLIGAPVTDLPALGQTWVFNRVGTSWVAKAQLKSTTSTSRALVVCLGSLGTTAAILDYSGVFGINVWKLVNDVWVETSTFLPTGFTNLKPTIDMSLAETSIVISAPANGAIVFDLVNNTWTPTANFLMIKNPIDVGNFGKYTAISADGLTVGVSDNAYALTGAVFIFRRSSLGSPFSQETYLSADPAPQTETQGLTFALSNNGNTCIICDPAYFDGNIYSGAIWIFDRTGVNWTQRGSIITGSGYGAGTAISSQKLGLNFILGSTSQNDYVGFVTEFAASGMSYDAAISITVPSGNYSIFDIVNNLNVLLANVIATGNGFRVEFDGGSKLTVFGVTNSPIMSNMFNVSTGSTFDLARWPSSEFKLSQLSNPMDFSINNDIIKSVVNHSDNSDDVIVDNTPDIIYRKYPAGYTIESGTQLDIQLRNDRDQIIDLNGADWIMTIYATVRS